MGEERRGGKREEEEIGGRGLGKRRKDEVRGFGVGEKCGAG